MPKLPYTTKHRLQDVLLLIQRLGFGAFNVSKRTLDGYDPPVSSTTWTEVAKAHPEFFRETDGSFGLILRYQLGKDKNQARSRDDLTTDDLKWLYEIAFQMHERQLEQAHAWRPLLTLCAALVAAVASLVQLFL